MAAKVWAVERMQTRSPFRVRVDGRMLAKKSFRLRGSQPLLPSQTSSESYSHRDSGIGAKARQNVTALKDSWIWLVVLLFTFAVMRRAWMCDDAFITMRAVDHLVAGRGLVFNAGERVLGFTNPLWALLVAVPYTLTRDPYLTPILMGVVIAGATAALLAYRGGRDRRVSALVVVALCFSRAFVDFSTSGLENPLTHLLLVAFFGLLLRPTRQWLPKLGCIAALVIVNRFDAVVLVAPGILIVLWRNRTWAGLRSLAIGATPAVAWFGFSLTYYGFLLPNTAYAKLNAHIPTSERVQQGFAYLVDTVINDPMTAILIAIATLVLILRGPKDHLAWTILVTIALDLAYVVNVGGDFMSGRFLTPTLAVSAVALTHFGPSVVAGRSRMRVAALSLAGVVFSSSFTPFRDDPLREKREIPLNRIVNERAWYEEHLSLLVNVRPVTWREDGLYLEGKRAREKGEQVVEFGNIGMYSWGAGPAIHVVDNQALTDPLLARIPYQYSPDWRTGHLGRAVPAGYIATLLQHNNQLSDSCLARYYDQLEKIVRGPLFSVARWQAIAQLNSPGGFTARECPFDRAQALVSAAP
jgi:arabinofuranosyltransferase